VLVIQACKFSTEKLIGSVTQSLRSKEVVLNEELGDGSILKGLNVSF
jgi:hypothetical protein